MNIIRVLQDVSGGSLVLSAGKVSILSILEIVQGWGQGQNVVKYVDKLWSKAEVARLASWWIRVEL